MSVMSTIDSDRARKVWAALCASKNEHEASLAREIEEEARRQGMTLAGLLEIDFRAGSPRSLDLARIAGLPHP